MSGPGLDHAVLTTLDIETPVTGYAYLGGWIRVEVTEGDRGGWVHRELVAAR